MKWRWTLRWTAQGNYDRDRGFFPSKTLEKRAYILLCMSYGGIYIMYVLWLLLGLFETFLERFKGTKQMTTKGVPPPVFTCTFGSELASYSREARERASLYTRLLSRFVNVRTHFSQHSPITQWVHSTKKRWPNCTSFLWRSTTVLALWFRPFNYNDLLEN